jgi:hypothetical protein
LAGIGSNVVQVTKLDVFTTTSTSYATVTGLSVTITPSSNTAKILLIAQVAMSDFQPQFQLSGGNTSGYIGNAAGSRSRVTVGTHATAAATEAVISVAPIVFLDSPLTASPVTYNVTMRSSGGSAVHVNRSRQDSDVATTPRTTSSLTAIEVAV